MEENYGTLAGNSNNSKRKLVIITALLAVALSATAIIVLQQSAVAQTSSNGNSTSSSTKATVPQLKGSVSILNATNDFVKNNVKVSFATAANTALNQVSGGTLIGGRLSDVQGYIAYVFDVANYNAGTHKIVIVDVGNGSVLYTSPDMTLYNGGLGGGFGCHRGHGYGHGWDNDDRQTSSSSGSSSSLPV